jgi:hypothetical protein
MGVKLQTRLSWSRFILKFKREGVGLAKRGGSKNVATLA